jgi:hypothetical protein
MPSAVVLEVTETLVNSLRGKIHRICDSLTIDRIPVHHRRSQADFEATVNKLAGEHDPTMLIFCDIEDQQGKRAQELQAYIQEIWNRHPPDDWIARRPVIVYSRSDAILNKMKKAPARLNREVPSAVISQNATIGNSPLDELKAALSDSIRAL